MLKQKTYYLLSCRILPTSIKNGGTTIPTFKASLGVMQDIKLIPYY